MLGVLYAALGAFTFSLNNVTMRRGVVTGSVLQGMALTVPIGGLSFLLMATAFGDLNQILVFPAVAVAWLAAQGIVHFVLGRYCNYKSNQLMGVNLAAPVIQLQVPFAMLLAVVTLHERFTVLQAIGSALMLGGSFMTQSKAGTSKKRSPAPLSAAVAAPAEPAHQAEAGPHTERKPIFGRTWFQVIFSALGRRRVTAVRRCWPEKPSCMRPASAPLPAAASPTRRLCWFSPWRFSGPAPGKTSRA